MLLSTTRRIPPPLSPSLSPLHLTPFLCLSAHLHYIHNEDLIPPPQHTHTHTHTHSPTSLFPHPPHPFLTRWPNSTDLLALTACTALYSINYHAWPHLAQLAIIDLARWEVLTCVDSSNCLTSCSKALAISRLSPSSVCVCKNSSAYSSYHSIICREDNGGRGSLYCMYFTIIMLRRKSRSRHNKPAIVCLTNLLERRSVNQALNLLCKQSLSLLKLHLHRQVSIAYTRRSREHRTQRHDTVQSSLYTYIQVQR